MAAAVCSNCGGLLGVAGHARANCPAILGQALNAAENHSLAAYTRPLIVSRDPFSSEAFAVVDAVQASMERADNLDDAPAEIDGLDAVTLEVLTERVRTRQLSHPAFTAEVGRRIAVAPVANAVDRAEIDRLGTLTAWSSGIHRNDTVHRNPLLSSTHLGIKKGVLAKLLETVYRSVSTEEKADAHAAGVPLTLTRDLAGQLHTISSEDGSIDNNLGTGRFTLVMSVWELFRHILVACGHAAELSIHNFVSWHLKRILAGVPLAIMERCFAVLIGKIDQCQAQWWNVLLLHSQEALNLLQLRHGNSAGAEGTSAPTNGTQTKGGIKLTSCCICFNQYDEQNPGKSKPCASTPCTHQHVCTALTKEGYLCGMNHPNWLHTVRTSNGRSRGGV